MKPPEVPPANEGDITQEEVQFEMDPEELRKISSNYFVYIINGFLFTNGKKMI